MRLTENKRQKTVGYDLGNVFFEIIKYSVALSIQSQFLLMITMYGTDLQQLQRVAQFVK